MIDINAWARSSRAINAGLLCLVIIGLGARTTAVTAAPNPGSYGYLVIEDTGSDKVCKIDLATARKFMMRGNEQSCGFGWVGKMWLEHAASAITISFVQNSAYKDQCRYSSVVAYPKNITIKTAGQNLTTSQFTLETIKTVAPEDDVVVPGVRVTHSDFDGSDPSKDVECLFISPSTLP